MSKTKHMQTPLDKKAINSLKAGEEVLLSGTIYTARDQAHMRLSGLITEGGKLPLELTGQVIYYCGPAPAKTGPIGSCGPTTSGRMDPFTPMLLDAGLKGMIGKGRRSQEVADAIKKNGAVYFIAPGGAGAYLREKVISCVTVAFEDLGPEAIYKLEVKDFPLVVGIDTEGKDIYSKL
ncbi:MAG: fumarate hydratase C-terminal domain-containing protein [Candidatus Omnitrophica bacterium]|nr:fumarate hydratase C-terminal domain-containing protein [Candidatus Omnitrophota bacterium]